MILASWNIKWLIEAGTTYLSIKTLLIFIFYFIFFLFGVWNTSTHTNKYDLSCSLSGFPETLCVTQGGLEHFLPLCCSYRNVPIILGREELFSNTFLITDNTVLKKWKDIYWIWSCFSSTFLQVSIRQWSGLNLPQLPFEHTVTFIVNIFGLKIISECFWHNDAEVVSTPENLNWTHAEIISWSINLIINELKLMWKVLI